MRYAVHHHRLVSANQANENLEYTCPLCHRRVILHSASLTRRAFFVHDGKSPNYYNPAETSEHLTGKRQLLNFFKAAFNDVKVERYLPSINQWPDLMFNRTAIEFQCSPISPQRLNERIDGYTRLGIKSWWLLGSPYYHRRLRATYLTRFMNYSRKLGFFILYWRVQINGLEIHYRIREVGGHLAYRRKRLYSCRELFAFISRSHLRNPLKSRNRFVQIMWSDVKVNQRRLFHGDDQLLRLQTRINPHHNSLMGCPVIAHLPLITFPIFRGRALLWRIWIIILLTRCGDLRKVYRTANLRLNFPLRFCQIRGYSKFYRVAFKDYVRLLRNHRYLRLNGKKITGFREPRWFNSCYDKFKALNDFYRFR